MPAFINITQRQFETAAQLELDLTVYESGTQGEALEFVHFPDGNGPSKRSIIIDIDGTVLSDRVHNGELDV